jgi:hypothetical protein
MLPIMETLAQKAVLTAHPAQHHPVNNLDFNPFMTARMYQHSPNFRNTDQPGVNTKGTKYDFISCLSCFSWF